MILLLAACGDGVVGRTYPGEPLLTVSGLVDAGDTLLDQREDYGVTIAWAGGEAVDTPDQFIDTSFPAFYELNLYQGPPEGTPAIKEIEGVLVQAAIVFLYRDIDRDGGWDADSEPFVGASTPFALTYSTGEWSLGPAAGTGADVIADDGYNALRFDGQTGCLESVLPASPAEFNILLDDKVLPDMNCDGSKSEWDLLEE